MSSRARTHSNQSLVGIRGAAARRVLASVLVAVAGAASGAGCGSSKPGVAVPSVPLPPPRFTSSTVLPKGLVVTGESQTLGDAFDRIKTALERAAISEWSVYAFADDGFAIVTRLETIRDSGEPSNTRWSARHPPYRVRGFEVEGFRQRLFNEPPGRYRVFLFAVTAQPFASEHDKPPLVKGLDMDDLASGKLPDALRDRSVPPGARCEVLVYELLRPRDLSAPAALLETSPLDANAHLVGAGLWRREELGN